MIINGHRIEPNADLSFLDLRDAKMSMAMMTSSTAIATTFDRSELRYAKMARINISGSSLEKIDCSGADLNHATMRSSLGMQSVFIGVNFNDSVLVLSDLSDGILTNCQLYNADLRGVNLSRANLLSATITDARLDFADLSQTNMDKSDFTGTNLTGVHMINASGRWAVWNNCVFNLADLSWGNYYDGKFIHAVCFQADLSNCNFAMADFTDANLMNADLSSASLQRTNLKNANLDGANLSKANLLDAKITFEQLSYASSLSGTIMPDGTVHR